MIPPRFLWSVLAVTPVALTILQGATRRTLLAWGFYALGWLLLVIARRRDPDSSGWTGFWDGSIGQAALLGAIVVLQLFGLVLSTPNLLLLVVGVGVGVLGLWVAFPAERSLRSVASRLMLLTGSLLLVLVAGELFLRLPFVIERTGGTQLDKARWADEHYDAIWESNIFRLRSFHTETPKAPGAIRIVTLGDSYTWGDKIPNTSDTWPYVLEADLQAEGYTVEVVNLARNGYSAVNHSEALRRLGWRFEPDIAIVQLFLNDPLPSGPNFRAERGLWLYRTRALLPLLHSDLNRNSYLYAFLDQRFRLAQIAKLYPDGLAPLYAEDFDGWLAMKQALVDISEQAQRREVSVLVVLFPYLVDLAPDRYIYAEQHEKIAAAVDEAGLPFLDLWPLYAEIDPNGKRWWVLTWDSHPGPEAHQLAGEAIADRLRETLGPGDDRH